MTDKENTLNNSINADVIDSLQVNVEAFISGTRMSIAEISSLTAGSTIKMDATLGQDIELRLNGVTIAVGELVTVDDHFAVRVTNIPG